MGTLFKYFIYLALIVIAYFVFRGVWNESITEDSTVREVVSQVGNDMDATARNLRR